MDNVMTIKAEQMRKELQRMEYLSQVYSLVQAQMNWDVMVRTEDKDEDGNYIYVAPNEDSWDYSKYEVWCEVMKAIEKLAK